jgi:hypothetical protein
MRVGMFLGTEFWWLFPKREQSGSTKGHHKIKNIVFGNAFVRFLNIFYKVDLSHLKNVYKNISFEKYLAQENDSVLWQTVCHEGAIIKKPFSV